MSNTSSKLPAPEREQIIYHISKLLDLSNDLERNRLDARFADRSGRIHYIYDETVFEMFFRPIDRRMAISTFYWSQTVRSNQDLRERWRKFEAQAAVVGSEYLLSAELPGMDVDKSMYLTPWHRLELASRVEDQTARFSENARKNLPVLRKEIEAKNQLLARFQPNADTGVTADDVQLDDSIVSHLHEMQKYDEEQDVFRSPFSLTQQAVRLAVDSRFCEPLDQLSRLVSERMTKRMRTLTEKYKPSAEDLVEIEGQARVWFYRLKQEAMRSKYHRTRKSGSFWSDAKSLALVQWIVSRHSDRRTRFVFVTHDDVLYNAYRRWDAELKPGMTGFQQPYFMRRVLQYSPLLNLSQAKSDLFQYSSKFNEISRDLFEMISAAA